MLDTHRATCRAVHDQVVAVRLGPNSPLGSQRLTRRLNVDHAPVQRTLLVLGLTHVISVGPRDNARITPVGLGLVRVRRFTHCALRGRVLGQLHNHIAPQRRRRCHDGVRACHILRTSVDRPSHATHVLRLSGTFRHGSFRLYNVRTRCSRVLTDLRRIRHVHGFDLLARRGGSIYSSRATVLRTLLRNDTSSIDRTLRDRLDQCGRSITRTHDIRPRCFVSR